MFSNTFEVLLSYKYAKWLWSCPKHNAKTEGSNFQIKFMIDLCNKKGAERRTEGEGGGKGSIFLYANANEKCGKAAPGVDI